jgi:hypothetical protein
MTATLTPVTAGFLCAAIACASLVTPTRADTGGPTWQPRFSERLVKLPASYLKKSLDRDFSGSALAQAMSDTNVALGLKVQTLEDLRLAVDQAEGDVKVELRHQFLAEKREYLDLLKSHQDLRRRHLDTRIKVYGRLLGKLNRQQSAQTPERASLIEKQDEARTRLERTVDTVDVKLFGTPATPESKYSREYARNLGAMNALITAIKAHPMAQSSDADLGSISKPEFVRRLVADSEAERALLDQEGQILGHMAKLVALDAMALSDDLQVADSVDDDSPEAASVAAAVDLFIP